jgi:DNA-binding beta-propeller fold protein YncE
VVDTFKVGVHPQHVVPSWDLRILWVANNAEGRTDGSLTPIDPVTGKPGKSIPVDDPYNMYWSPDGRHAIVVAEAYKRLDFRDVNTMELQYSIATPRAPASTMPISRSTAGLPCSPASSAAPSPRSTWSSARCSAPSS